MKKIAIIGGGISGLSAAFHLEKARRQGAKLEYVLYEKSPRLGGILRTEPVEGFTVEAGADSFLTEKPEALQLCRALGIEDQIIGSLDAQRKTYIALHRKLLELPGGMQFFIPADVEAAVRSELFSEDSKHRIREEVKLQPVQRAADHDESVRDFVERHFGGEMACRVAAPLLAGIYGGDISRLSMRAVLPRFLEMEARHGSLIRALQAGASANRSPSSPTSKPPLFSSLRSGMQSLAEALAKQLPSAAWRLNRTVRAIRPEAGCWRLESSEAAPEIYDAIILAAPAFAAAEILESALPDLATELGAIRYTHSITVALGFKADAALQSRIPPGFGFLVPRAKPGEHSGEILACTFVQQKFPHRAPPGCVLLRAFLGGSQNENLERTPDGELSSQVMQYLEAVLGFAATPCFSRVYRWHKAMPQYELGHIERIQRIENLAAQMPALLLAGSAYHGVGIPDCISSGKQAAESAVRSLAT